MNAALRARSLPMVAAGMVIIAAVLTAHLWQTGFFLEVFHKRSLLTPVLLMDVDLSESGRSSQTFSLEYPGRYSVHLDLKPRTVSHDGSILDRTLPELVLEGDVQIRDDDGSTILHRQVRVPLTATNMIPKVFDFDGSDIGLRRPRSFVLALRPTPELRQRYERIRVYVVRELRYAILD